MRGTHACATTYVEECEPSDGGGGRGGTEGSARLPVEQVQAPRNVSGEQTKLDSAEIAEIDNAVRNRCNLGAAYITSTTVTNCNHGAGRCKRSTRLPAQHKKRGTVCPPSVWPISYVNIFPGLCKRRLAYTRDSGHHSQLARCYLFDSKVNSSRQVYLMHAPVWSPSVITLFFHVAFGSPLCPTVVMDPVIVPSRRVDTLGENRIDRKRESYQRRSVELTGCIPHTTQRTPVAPLAQTTRGQIPPNFRAVPSVSGSIRRPAARGWPRSGASCPTSWCTSR